MGALKKLPAALIFLARKAAWSMLFGIDFDACSSASSEQWNYDAIACLTSCQRRSFWADPSFDANTNRIQLVKCKKHRHVYEMTQHRLCAVAIIYVMDALSWHEWTLFLVNWAAKTYWISAFCGLRTCCSTFLRPREQPSQQTRRTFELFGEKTEFLFRNLKLFFVCICGPRKQWSIKNARCINHGRFKLNFCEATQFFPRMLMHWKKQTKL